MATGLIAVRGDGAPMVRREVRGALALVDHHRRPPAVVAGCLPRVVQCIQMTHLFQETLSGILVVRLGGLGKRSIQQKTNILFGRHFSPWRPDREELFFLCKTQ